MALTPPSPVIGDPPLRAAQRASLQSLGVANDGRLHLIFGEEGISLGLERIGSSADTKIHTIKKINVRFTSILWMYEQRLIHLTSISFSLVSICISLM